MLKKRAYSTIEKKIKNDLTIAANLLDIDIIMCPYESAITHAVLQKSQDAETIELSYHKLVKIPLESHDDTGEQVQRKKLKLCDIF